MTMIAEIASLCNGPVSIDINDHRSDYITVEEWMENRRCFDDDFDTDTPKGVRDKMIEYNTIVQVQCYPDTPIGFYTVFHYDIDAALESMLSILDPQPTA